MSFFYCEKSAANITGSFGNVGNCCDMHSMKNNGKYEGDSVSNWYVWLFLTARRHFFLIRG